MANLTFGRRADVSAKVTFRAASLFLSVSSLGGFWRDPSHLGQRLPGTARVPRHPGDKFCLLRIEYLLFCDPHRKYNVQRVTHGQHSARHFPSWRQTRSAGPRSSTKLQSFQSKYPAARKEGSSRHRGTVYLGKYPTRQRSYPSKAQGLS